MSEHKPRSNDELVGLLLDRHPPVSIYDDSSIQTLDNYDGPELSHYLDPWDQPPPKTADMAKMKPHDAHLCRLDLDSPMVPCDKLHPKAGSVEAGDQQAQDVKQYTAVDGRFKASSADKPAGTAKFHKEHFGL